MLSSAHSGRQFNSSTQGSGPETMVPRIDLTLSDNDDGDTTPTHQLTPMRKIKLEPQTSDVALPVKVKAEPMFVDLTM